MARIAPSSARALAGLTLALALGLALMAVPVAPAAAETTIDSVVDITYPAEPGTSFTDDYDDPRGGGRTHCATDIIGPKHSEIYAAVGGTVTFMPMEKPSYGYMIRIAGDDGRKYSYVHLNDDTPGTTDASAGPEHAYAPGLEEGSVVTRGQHIGWMGDSGNAKGGPDHLHFEIHDPAVEHAPCEVGGINRMNPFGSLESAVERGDYATASASGTSTARGIEQACPPDRVEAARYPDVAGTHQDAVDCVSWWEIAQGRTDGTYAPVDPISRAQLASFAVRLAEAVGSPLPPATHDHFDDDDGSVHEDAINRVADAGIMGSADRSFSPDLAVTRGSMATVVAGTHRVLAGAELPSSDVSFSDVPSTHPHHANIGRVNGAGIAVGYGDGTFGPDVAVTREQMATFLARLLDLAVEDGWASVPAS
ncbi:MAG TPA: S-layer homology domain-containing protein [Acidimicrobiales bacterium]|nr:S-layer homology domain-containing protein [Acidimicrobiales bacterium]